VRPKSYYLLDWLGLRGAPDFSKSRPLGYFLGFLLILLSFLLICSFGIVLIDFLLAGLHVGRYSSDLDGTAVRNTGLVLAALLGAPFVVWRTIISEKQVGVAEEALYNDKINSAANGLSSRFQKTLNKIDGEEFEVVTIWQDDQVVRASSIDQLEGLIEERSDLAPRLVKLIASYVRGTFGAENLNVTEAVLGPRVPRMDLQKSVDSIGKLLPIARQVDASNWRLDLRRVNFDGVVFRGGDFFAADFTESRFEFCDMEDASFEGARFSGALLNYSCFRGANLRGANFDRCILNRPSPQLGGINVSINLAENFDGLSLIKADISSIDYLGEKEEISKTFGTKDTVVSEELARQMPFFGDWRLAVNYKISKKPKSAEAYFRVKETGFQSWSPFDSSDLGTASIKKRLMAELDLDRWPYI